MGNIECCQQKSNPDNLESQEELYIRDTLKSFSKNMVNNEKLYKYMKRCFSILLLDIDGPPLDWISEESYNAFVSKIFEKDSPKKEKELDLIKLEYNKVKNISIKDYENNFHLLLCLWLVGIAPMTTMDDDEKIKIIKNTIIKCNKYITYKTFSKFLNTFLEMMLIEITYNFQNHNPQESKMLLNDIYNNMHVSEYCRWLCWKMGKIITKNKKITLSETKEINNEFVRDEHLLLFFKKNSFLLRPVDLRSNFYNKYKI